MQGRNITLEQAREVRHILEEECGLTSVDRCDRLVTSIVVTDKTPAQGICTEYRFMGSLGFGGKFRNNGNHDNTPYVDCYQEDKNPTRLAMIARANKRLTELFAHATAK